MILITVVCIGLFDLRISLINVKGISSSQTYNVNFVGTRFSHDSEEIKSAVINSTSAWRKEPPANNTFYVAGSRNEPTWGVLSMTTVDLLKPNDFTDKIHPFDFDETNTFSILYVKVNNTWDAALDTDTKVQSLLSNVPLDELGTEARRAIFPPSKLIINTNKVHAVSSSTQSYFGYRWFWNRSNPFRISPANNVWHGGQTRSIDFIPTTSNDDLISASSGTVSWFCEAFDKATSSIRQYSDTIMVTTAGYSENITYGHTDPRTGLGTSVLSRSITQGDKIGVPFDPGGSGVYYEDTCGSGWGTHTHVTFPSKPFIIDCTYLDSSNSNLPSASQYSTQTLESDGDLVITPDPGQISKDCNVKDTRKLPKDLIIKSGGVMTIDIDTTPGSTSNGEVDLKFSNSQKVLVKDGGKLLIKNNAKLGGW